MGRRGGSNRGGNNRGRGRGRGRGGGSNRGSHDGARGGSSDGKPAALLPNVEMKNSETHRVTTALAEVRAFTGISSPVVLQDDDDDDDACKEEDDQRNRHDTAKKERDKKVRAALVEQLTAMGFSQKAAFAASSLSHDLHACIDWIFSNAPDQFVGSQDPTLEVVDPSQLIHTANAALSAARSSIEHAMLMRAGLDNANDAIAKQLVQAGLRTGGSASVPPIVALGRVAVAQFFPKPPPYEVPWVTSPALSGQVKVVDDDSELGQEIFALEAIFGEALQVSSPPGGWLQISLRLEQAGPAPVFVLLIPPDYPGQRQCPIAMCQAESLSGQTRLAITEQLCAQSVEAMSDDSPGPQLYDLCCRGNELIDEALEKKAAEDTAAAAAEAAAAANAAAAAAATAARQAKRNAAKQSSSSSSSSSSDKVTQSTSFYIERSRRQALLHDERVARQQSRQRAADRLLTVLKKRDESPASDDAALESQVKQAKQEAAAADAALAATRAPKTDVGLSLSKNIVVSTPQDSDLVNQLTELEHELNVDSAPGASLVSRTLYLKQWGLDVQAAKQKGRAELSADDFEFDAQSRVNESDATLVTPADDAGDPVTNGPVEGGDDGPTRSEGGHAAQPKESVESVAVTTPPQNDGKLNAAQELVRVERLNEQLKSRWQKQKQNPKYRKMLAQRKKLPAWHKQEDIIGKIHQSQVVVITGATGSGKSTQTGQFILNDALENGRGARTNIICTQPRRLASISLAERVADERAGKCGGEIGYSIRLESKQSKRTRLLFVTTGVLLRRLQVDDQLTGVSHVIIDEVHERSAEIDFLLCLIRDLLQARPLLKLILMSATTVAQKFIDYFNPVVTSSVATVHIEGRTFPVEPVFLETVVDQLGYVVDPDGDYAKKRKRPGRGADVDAYDADANAMFQVYRNAFPDISEHSVESLATMDHDKINYEIVVELAWKIATGTFDGDAFGQQNEQEGILIFLPGLAEVTQVYDELQARGRERSPHGGGKSRVLVLALHSSLANLGHDDIFRRPPPGVTKIVCATNIAETSLTIEDITVVIDCCRVKESGFNTDLQLSTLDEVRCSQAACLQRRGRAGRVRPGRCFHLVTSLEYETMSKHQVPEIKRTALESLILQMLFLGLNARQHFEQFLDPPSRNMVNGSMRRLRVLGAIEFDELTALGFYLAQLPVAPHFGKIMVLGAMFGVLEAVLVIISCSENNVFVSPMGKRDQADAARKKLSSLSDHLAMLNAYRGWKRASSSGRSNERSFCTKFYLSSSNLRSAERTVRQFAGLLKELGFELEDSSQFAHHDRLVLACIGAGLYPNVAKMLPAVASGGGGGGGGGGARTELQALDGSRCRIHPSSVLGSMSSSQGDANGKSSAAWSWFVFSSRFKTREVYLRSVSPVSQFAILFFVGNLKTYPKKQELQVDSIRFSVDVTTMSLVKEVRRLLAALLMQHIETGKAEGASILINGILRLL